MTISAFDMATLPVSPWRNGGGETREIISWPADTAEFDWRASIATIAQDGPFSRFAGIDRSITLLAGDGVHLVGEGQLDHALTERWHPFAFSGDIALEATLAGGSSIDFNIMSRRGRWQSQVQVIRGNQALPTGHAGVVLVLQGRWLLSGLPGWQGTEHQGAWWSAEANVGQLSAVSDDSVLLWVDLTALTQ